MNTRPCSSQFLTSFDLNSSPELFKVLLLLHLPHEEAETQRSQVACPRALWLMRVEPGLEPGRQWVFMWLGLDMRIDGFCGHNSGEKGLCAQPVSSYLNLARDPILLF